MRSLKAIALLLHYPDALVMQHSQELQDVFQQDLQLSAENRQALGAFVEAMRGVDLLERQAEYGELFDRGRSLSLHLFEHVHGESRDRGQAMVDLVRVYREQGFEISANELPDYVPLFLEFCSTLPKPQAQEWLQEVGHLFQLLHGRLEERGSEYSVLFQALLELAELPAADRQLRSQLRAEERDDTPEALDKAWLDEPVMFGPTEGCSTAKTHTGQAVPVQWSDLRKAQG